MGGGKGRVIPCKLKAIVFLPGVASYLSLRKRESVNFVKVFPKIYRMLVFLSGILALVVVIAVFLLCIFFYVFS